MKIYLDSNYMCHLNPDKGIIEAENDFFDGKCALFIENYRFVPFGYSWKRPDGIILYGEILTPVNDCGIPLKVQQQYEIDEINHLNELGSLIEDLYNADLEVIG